MSDQSIKLIVDSLPAVMLAFTGLIPVLLGAFIAVWNKLEKVHKQGNSLYVIQLQNTAIAYRLLAKADPTPENIQAADKAEELLAQHMKMSQVMNP